MLFRSNGVPKAIAPSAPTVYEDDTDVEIADDIQVIDEDNDPQTVTFTITGGTLTIGTAGVTFGGSGNGSSSFTASGTLAAINTALDAAKFTPTPNLFGTNAGKIEFISNDGQINSNTASVIFDIIRVKYPSPVILFINPGNGPAKGETEITITGMNFFVGLTEVYFGSVLVPAISMTDTQIKVLTPAGSGTVQVFVTSAGGTSNSLSFSYHSPSISALFPTNGPTAGGTEVTITGINFTNAASVNFGFVSVPFTFISDTTIKFTTPSSSGTANVTVTSASGISNSLPFTYDPPAISAISPTHGTAAGGMEVVISGINFTGATAVNFGSASAPITFVSDTVIKVISPAGSGTVNVTVTTAVGTSAASQFSYDAPSITSLSPSSGPAAGGTEVVISGINFTDATAVHFGMISVPIINITDTAIIVISPAGSGIVDVTVTSAGGTSNALPFKYVPSISSLSPTHGPAAGGISVVISGSGLAGETAVDFGGTLAAITNISDTEITVILPRGSGTVDVTVTTAGGTSGALQFTYDAPSITSLSPSSGPAAGGTEVVISGINFTDATAVHFGMISVPIINITDTAIIVISPAGSGIANVTVTSASGISNSLPFTYFKVTPVITWENPADITYGTALSGTQLNATADVDGTFVYTPALGTFLDAGFAQELKVDFTPDDTDKYETASKTVFINVAPGLDRKSVV